MEIKHITAIWILGFFNLCILFAGQFIPLLPFLSLSAILLWIEIIKTRKIALLQSIMFWLWFGFCGMVLTQVLNHGYTIEHGDKLQVVMPNILCLPFTVHLRTAILTFVTWILIAGLCISLPDIKHDINFIQKTALIIAVMLAILGIAQHYTNTKLLSWIIPYKKGFFSVFLYVNNAGTFFMLAGGLALHRSWRNLPLFLLFAYCAYLTKTRFALGCFAIMFICKCLEKNKGNKYVIVMMIVSAWYLFANEIFRCRYHEYGINFKMIAERPVFGWGISGNTTFHWLYAKEYLHELLSTSPNTHCDPIVFCVEYGLVGALCLCVIALKVFRNAIMAGKELRLTCANLAMFLAVCHSFIDMPFRCPAIIGMIFVLLLSNSQRDISLNASTSIPLPPSLKQ